MNEYKTSKKYALSFIAIMALLLALLALSTPATAEYIAEDTKMNIYKQGEGDLNYTYGGPYQCVWGYDSEGNSDTGTFNINLAHIPNLAKLIEDEEIEARLYVYWTWSGVDVCDNIKYGVSWNKDYGVYPALDAEFNGEPVSFDYAPGTDWIADYTDAKKISAVGLEWFEAGRVGGNFPSGTNCSNIPVNLLLSGNNVVSVTNMYPYQGPVGETYCPLGYISGTGRARVCIQGVGLLLTLKEDNKRYWIAEGNDMTHVYWYKNDWKYGRNPEMATTKVTFAGPVEEDMNKAILTSVIPLGCISDDEHMSESCAFWYPNNRLYFNYFFNTWDGLWISKWHPIYPNIAVSVTDVSDSYLLNQDNVAGFQNGLYSGPQGCRCMQVANAFLVVEKEV
ncbi:MAG: DUF3344 domain-containing protein [Methanophagales archaeon]|nr:DUF3344 domain-containing protein [Methanophagales archaeon]